ncbi:MAG: outer membrane protein assembly factor BamB family protein, partial [Planctomycetota bacterium]
MQMRRILVAGVLASVFTSGAWDRALALESREQVAREILEATGVKGGLIIHVGCGDGELTAALRVNDRYLVHGLDSDGRNVARARKHVQELGLYGPVSIDLLRDKRLPYTDNLVNVVVAEQAMGVPAEEVTRVLRPGGVAYVKQDGRWKKTVKAWPADIDEWTHFLHGPDNNAVAEDTQVAPPHHVQWVAGPRWGRSHDHLASMSAAVSAAGRLFYIVDEGAIASVKETSHWALVARDAFNGVLLWKKQVGPWEDQLRPFRSGPAELPRRLVAAGERVYVTLGYGKPVTALDAATGEEVRRYEGTENTHEILHHEGKLYLVVSDPLADELAKESGTTGGVIRRLPDWRDFYHRFVTQYPAKRLQCMRADSGELLWQKKDGDTEHVLPMTPALSGNRLFFENEREILALEADTGEILWRAARPVAVRRYAWSAPTVVVKDGVVLSADRSPDANLDTGGGDRRDLEWLVTANHLLTGGEIMAFSAATGRKLWTAPCHEGFNAPVDLFVAHGKVWSGELAWGRQPGITEVYDLQTGAVVTRRPADQECYTLGFGHSRCYRHKATTKYVLHGRAGVEFLDMNSNRVVADHWVRGTCQYGILPCNGLLYAPPHSCACYVEAKL